MYDAYLQRGARLKFVFIRAAHGRVPGVIQRRIGTHVGGHRNTEAQVGMLKPSQKGSKFI